MDIRYVLVFLLGAACALLVNGLYRREAAAGGTAAAGNGRTGAGAGAAGFAADDGSLHGE